MKKSRFLTGILSLTLVFGMISVACTVDDSTGGGGGNQGGGGDTVISMTNIPLTQPVTGGIPATTVDTTQYSGTVSWNPLATGTFSANTGYSATITLTAKGGYTFNGVPVNFFQITGATTISNPANSGSVTVVFPATGAGGGGPSGNNPLAGTWFYINDNNQAQATVEVFTDSTWYLLNNNVRLPECTLSIGADNIITLSDPDQTKLYFEINNNELSVSTNGNVVIYNRKLDGTATQTNPALGIWVVDSLGQEKNAIAIGKLSSGKLTVIQGAYERSNYTLGANSDATRGVIDVSGTETEYQFQTINGKNTLQMSINGGTVNLLKNADLFPTFF